MNHHPEMSLPLGQQLQMQVKRYEQAILLAQRARLAYEQVGKAEVELDALQVQMTEIQTADQQLTPVKQAWTAAGRPKSQPLQDSLDRLAQLVQQLMVAVDHLEMQTRCERDRLAPQLTIEAKGRQMVAAYGDASRVR